MDVVVTPRGSDGKKWDLVDRLGRKLGDITEKGNGYAVYSEKPGSLGRTQTFHKSLDEAMSDIAANMKGACELAAPLTAERPPEG